LPLVLYGTGSHNAVNKLLLSIAQSLLELLGPNVLPALDSLVDSRQPAVHRAPERSGAAHVTNFDLVTVCPHDRHRFDLVNVCPHDRHRCALGL